MSKIIAVHSYRGGTGKTNLTANLATILAARGERVGIMDGDIQSPGIHNLFDLTDEKITKTLNDYLWGRCPIQEAVYDVSGVGGIKGEGKIFLVPASSNSDEIARILSEGYNVSLLNEGIRQLMKQLSLSYFFIDTHPGLSKETFISIAISSTLIMLLRIDRQDYQGIAIMLDLAKRLKVPYTMLVVNQALRIINLELFQQQLEQTYEVSVAGILPLTEELVQLGSNGIFCQQYPDSQWTQNLIQICDRLTNLPKPSESH
ncbi:MAG TPA: MinD/ParA family protein [Coleofasciculaceae cyanobacterium]